MNIKMLIAIGLTMSALTACGSSSVEAGREESETDYQPLPATVVTTAPGAIQGTLLRVNASGTFVMVLANGMEQTFHFGVTDHSAAGNVRTVQDLKGHEGEDLMVVWTGPVEKKLATEISLLPTQQH